MEQFDYRAKYNYDDNEAGVSEIPDDATHLPDLLTELRQQYRTHVTRDYNFRIS